MKKLFFLTILTILSFQCFSQDKNVDNLMEFTCQVKETDNGYAIIVGNYDYISKEFWEQNILLDTIQTVSQAVNKMNRYGFRVKSTTSVNGKEIVTMSINTDKWFSEENMKRMKRIADELDSMFKTIEIKID